MFKRYDELKKGDKIWFYGYKAFVRDIKENGIVNDKNNIEHLGEKIFALNIGFEPSTDGIEKTIYNSNSFNYGGVASRTVGMRE
ncbi:hypothetical protein [Agathobacter rectalis]|uniref:Uncharacterized protein n=1 Tax=Agathobacter rectalis TaxID=39491 RepID=A0A3E5AKY4_9FIRM|nr:hypothetical protein [Agathobacter rectalis]MBO9144202.1 hypothetical protein [Escherichia coli]RGN16359.1 hypothetical protein DXB76_10985 [Agathobacter rectalis]RGN21548.1 hypothetical protein DXB72_12120 [Agathobacter rectalis]RGN21792.1 hypothetical protein DXB69_12170 [Agathobacter rectalis]